jgi:hypothetical protein
LSTFSFLTKLGLIVQLSPWSRGVFLDLKYRKYLCIQIAVPTDFTSLPLD